MRSALLKKRRQATTKILRFERLLREAKPRAWCLRGYALRALRSCVESALVCARLRRSFAGGFIPPRPPARTSARDVFLQYTSSFFWVLTTTRCKIKKIFLSLRSALLKKRRQATTKILHFERLLREAKPRAWCPRGYALRALRSCVESALARPPLTRGLLRGTASLPLPVRKTASCVSIVIKISSYCKIKKAFLSLRSALLKKRRQAMTKILHFERLLREAKPRAWYPRGYALRALRSCVESALACARLRRAFAGGFIPPRPPARTSARDVFLPYTSSFFWVLIAVRCDIKKCFYRCEARSLKSQASNDKNTPYTNIPYIPTAFIPSLQPPRSISLKHTTHPVQKTTAKTNDCATNSPPVMHLHPLTPQPSPSPQIHAPHHDTRILSSPHRITPSPSSNPQKIPPS